MMENIVPGTTSIPDDFIWINICFDNDVLSFTRAYQKWHNNVFLELQEMDYLHEQQDQWVTIKFSMEKTLLLFMRWAHA